jgi:membrane-associated phospholipid phosphatase
MLGAATGVVLLVVTWYAAFHVGVIERGDASVLRGFEGLRRPVIDRIATVIANLCDPKPYVCLATLVVVAGLLRRRVRVAVAAAGIMLAANFTTQILKQLLVQVHPVLVYLNGVPQIKEGSWPSGHATAAMSLALCSVLVAKARWRPFVAVAGAVFAVAVSFSFLTLIWHYPSDVLGGFLVAATWTLVGVAVVWTADRYLPRSAPGTSTPRLTVREALAPPAVAALGAVAMVGLVALARPRPVLAYARAHTAFVVGAAAIGALGLALATGLMLATTMRRPGR